MPKATLTFDLDEERNEFETATNGWKYKSVLWDINETLKRLEEYPQADSWPTQKEIDSDYYVDPLDPPKPLPAYDERVASHYYGKIRELLWRELGDENLGLD